MILAMTGLRDGVTLMQVTLLESLVSILGDSNAFKSV